MTSFRLLALIFITLITCNTSAMHSQSTSNLFQQGIEQRSKQLRKHFEQALKVLQTCKLNLDENPNLHNFHANFEIINQAYSTLYQAIAQNNELLAEFMELMQTEVMQKKITAIKTLFESFTHAIETNNPTYQMIDENSQIIDSLHKTITQFLANKQQFDLVATGNIEAIIAPNERKSELLQDAFSISIEPNTDDDEKLAQELQCTLNLEYMHEHEQAQQPSAPVIENQHHDDLIEIIEEPQHNLLNAEQPPHHRVTSNGASVFFRDTDHKKFVSHLKHSIDQIDITQPLDKGLFSQLACRMPTNFSLLAQREIGLATACNVMNYFNESSRNNFNSVDAQFFSECMMQDDIQSATLTGHNHYVTNFIQLADGRLASSSDDTTIKIWDLSTNQCVATLKGHKNHVNSIIQLANGRLASCSGDSTIKIWDLLTNQCVATLTGHEGSVLSIIQLADGRLASSSGDKTIKIWDLSSNQCIATLTEHKCCVNSITQLADGRLASCSNDKTIKIWNLSTNQCVATLPGHEDWAYSIIQLANGRLASCSDDTTIKIWDLSSNQCVTTLKGHKDWVYNITQLADDRLASCSRDTTIKIWDLSSNQCIATLTEYKYSVYSIIQLADGRLASCSADKTIKIWDLYPDDLSFEQIALVVHGERHLQENNFCSLGNGWDEIFESLPPYFQERFEGTVA